MKISSRFKIIIIIIIIAVLILSCFTVLQFLDLNKRLLEIKNDSVVLNDIRSMEVNFQKLVISALDIYYTGDISEKRIVAVKLSFTEVERELKQIKEHNSGTDNLKQIITLAENLIKISKESILQPIFNRKKISSDINEKIIYEILDPLHVAIKDENKELNIKMNSNYEIAEKLRDRYVRFFTPSIIVSLVLLSFFLYRSMKKGITALTVLQSNLENLAGEDVSLDLRLTESGGDETAELGKAFNSFIKQLSGMISELEIIAGKHSETGLKTNNFGI